MAKITLAPVTIDPLLAELPTFTYAYRRPKSMIAGDTHGHLIPCVVSMIESKGFKVADDADAFFMLMRAFDHSGDPAILACAMEVAFGVSPSGMTAYSTDQKIMPSFVMFNYNKLQPNTQLAVALHELGHVLTPMNIKNKAEALAEETEPSIRYRECIAYAVQFGCCTALGLDSKANALEGLHSYGVTPEDLHANKELILSASQEIVQWIAAHNS